MVACENCEFKEKELHQLRKTVIQLQADLKFVREKSKELLEAHQGRIRSLLRKYEARDSNGRLPGLGTS